MVWELGEARATASSGELVAAPYGRRVLAYAVEGAVWVILSLPGMFGFMRLSEELVTETEPSPIGLVLIGISAVLILLFFVGQQVLLGTRGVTLGKALFGIRAVGIESSAAPGVGRALVRWLVLAGASILPGVGTGLVLASPLFDPDRTHRGWHDKAAKLWLIDVREGDNPLTGALGRRSSAARDHAAAITPPSMARADTQRAPIDGPAYRPGERSQPASSAQSAPWGVPAAQGPHGAPVQGAPLYGAPLYDAPLRDGSQLGAPAHHAQPAAAPAHPAHAVHAQQPQTQYPQPQQPQQPHAPSPRVQPQQAHSPQAPSLQPQPPVPQPQAGPLAASSPMHAHPGVFDPARPPLTGRAPAPHTPPHGVPAVDAALDERTVMRVEPDDRTRVVGPGSVRGVLVFDSGEVYELVGGGTVGRDPVTAPDAQGVHVVAIHDETRSVSKTHFRFGFDEGGMWVADHHSTNGTRLMRGGREAVLAAGQLTRVMAGDVIQFGDRKVEVRSVAS